MSKSTTLKMNTNRNKMSKETTGTKQREFSKDGNGLRKTTSENAVASSSLGNSKSKPSVKLKESQSNVTNNAVKKTKQNLEKLGINEKSKFESSKTTTTTINKPSVKVNKTPTTANKTSLSTPHQKNLIKSKRSTAPETPPSNRVTKTQYFPSKNLYSNVVKEQSKLDSSSAPETVDYTKLISMVKGTNKIKKLERNEVKVTKNKTKVEKPHLSTDVKMPKNTEEIERPRTATLKRGSIVNSNIAGPDIPISETPSLTSLDLSFEQELKNEDEYNYEDDFDSYESDFEEYHSSDSQSASLSSSLSSDHNVIIEDETTISDDGSFSNPNASKQSTSTVIDEERMLDSGNFDLPENKHKQLLDNIKESNEQDNFRTDGVLNNRSNMASLSDEGFEEGKSLNSGNSPFINFIDAQKKWKQNKNYEKRKKRGEEILSMIRLDNYNFTLIDMAPVPYDVFIKSYGKTNTVQVPTQTGDDDTCEEVQTDTIELTNKWTQFPVAFSKINTEDPNYLELYKKEFLGVGDDFEININSVLNHDSINYKKLERFLSVSCQIVTTLLDEYQQTELEQIQQNKKEIPFSAGYVKYDIKLHPFLKDRPITYVNCTSSMQILTIHGRNKINHENVEDYLVLKSVICIWNTRNVKDPEKVLVTTGEVCFCNVLTELKSLVCGGLQDGSIAIWGFDNGQMQMLNGINHNKLQESSYITGVGSGHSSKVVSIQSLVNNADNFTYSNFELKPPNDQICSLEENGNLIIWSVIRKSITFNNKTTVPWHQISLVKNSILSLKDFNPDLTDLLCTDMIINSLDPHHLYISTNYGYIVHCLANGAKGNPKRFNPQSISQANCLELCPFSPFYFFAGHDDGIIVLYSRLLEKPLMAMSNKEDNLQSGVQILQWSHHRPCIFYAKDKSNAIHVWDLALSDLYPIYSIPFKEDITCMKLVSPKTNDSSSSYMILATQSGTLYLHVLNHEYGSSDKDSYQQDVTKFLNYVSRL